MNLAWKAGRSSKTAAQANVKAPVR